MEIEALVRLRMQSPKMKCLRIRIAREVSWEDKDRLSHSPAGQREDNFIMIVNRVPTFMASQLAVVKAMFPLVPAAEVPKSSPLQC